MILEVIAAVVVYDLDTVRNASISGHRDSKVKTKVAAETRGLNILLKEKKNKKKPDLQDPREKREKEREI